MWRFPNKNKVPFICFHMLIAFYLNYVEGNNYKTYCTDYKAEILKK
jgi:hypothetical protein